jgi:hypothetical protein
MAKKRAAVAARGSEIVVVNAAPPARRASGGVSRRRRSAPKQKRRRSVGGGGGGQQIRTRIQGVAAGGFLYGQLIKAFPDMPRLPILGTAGTVAAAVWFLKPKSQIVQDIGIAAAAIAGNSFGQTGSVQGDDLLEND